MGCSHTLKCSVKPHERIKVALSLMPTYDSLALCWPGSSVHGACAAAVDIRMLTLPPLGKVSDTPQSACLIAIVRSTDVR